MPYRPLSVVISSAALVWPAGTKCFDAIAPGIRVLPDDKMRVPSAAAFDPDGWGASPKVNPDLPTDLLRLMNA
jgi:hypothetical protein